ncbi:hypothetical protein Sa4125_12170 [Aureimonas sp. SA4125]|uniref:hypothetical protein n=1 Tax=Aureimonas sp. SA4125 TaxID=2826993 RepID=UPI001CC5858D|nr:hypothetical protein [Aureimonas sp. SA4125]BDA83675.1 hypothetical protein Sa4125_12170 [Aureimonas sp. SA4125]
MKHDSQRLFRALEKTAGRDGFDTIVSAAVASYGSLRSPGDNQARDFSRLVVPLWDKIRPETRRALAAALSHSPRVPRPIVDLLIAEPLEISAPFLTSSPVLGTSDLLALRASRDRRLRKIIAGRAPSPGSATPSPPLATPTASTEPLAAAPLDVSAPKPAGSPEPAAFETAAAPDVFTSEPQAAAPVFPELRTTGAPAAGADRSEAAPQTNDMTPSPQGAADLIRQTLRRLARPGGREMRGPSLHALVALAVQQDGASFYEGLRQALDLSQDVLVKIAEDDSGERLAVAVKALGAGPADALTILMMMKPDIGLDVAKFSLMTRFYRALKVEDCAAIAHGSRLRKAVSAPALEPQYQDLQPLPRAAPPAEFGRRAQRPWGEQKSSKSG